MAEGKTPEITERESMKVAEASRQAEWEKPSFMRELFLGRFRLDLVHPFPLPGEWRPEFKAFYEKFRAFLRDDREAAGGHGGRPQDPKDLRLRGGNRLAGGEGRAPLPLHGPARARQRGDQLHERPRSREEPHRRRGPRPEDRPHDFERRPAL